jgi:hypothetical protein
LNQNLILLVYGGDEMHQKWFQKRVFGFHDACGRDALRYENYESSANRVGRNFAASMPGIEHGMPTYDVGYLRSGKPFCNYP